MKDCHALACLLCGLAAGLPLRAQEAAAGPAEPAAPATIDLSGPEGPDSSAPKAVVKPLRFTVAHEASLRAPELRDLVNNRSWFRVEYSRLFSDSWFVQFDSKLNAYWRADHRAKAEDRGVLLETSTPEAFVQYSAAGGSTSIKLGVQRLIWGESEAGAITDEVSPRNFSELFFIPLEESRLGQFMLNVDHFSSSGDWSFFLIPRPRFNKQPDPGTAYFVDPFDGQADIRDGRDPRLVEAGMRWKKTFGSSDISLMGASLIDNDRVLRQDGVSGTGRLQIARFPQRFSLAGATFNHARGKFLVKGEVAFKSPQPFNDAALQVVEKDVVDASLGVTYSLGESDTVGLEFVNSHVRGWEDRIAGVPRNSSSVVLNTHFQFLNDTLSVDWLTILGRPHTSYQSSLRTSYKWSDNTTLSLDAHLIDVPDGSSPLFRYRRQDQVFFRIQYQF
jgi:hypothetical protein